MTKQTAPLPSFKQPPVTEVVLGIQFDELPNFTSLHYGLYQQRVRELYPSFQEQIPLDTFSERFGDESVPTSGTRVRTFTKPPLRRCWYLDDPQNRLIQLEPEHFYHNWRKVTGEESYPRYECIREEFKKLWEDFLLFAGEQQIGEVKPNHWEVTYVNHIDKNEGWDSLNDLKNIFSQWCGDTSEKFLPPPETIEMKQTYVFPEQKGRLHVSLNRAIRQRDNKECLLFKLTAHGRLNTTKSDVVLNSLDIGRNWIVRGFSDLTTPNAHKLWEREA